MWLRTTRKYLPCFGSVIRDIKSVLKGSDLLPKDVYYSPGGLYAQQQIAFTGLMAVFISAVILVFLLLLFLYESFRVAIAMLATTLRQETAAKQMNPHSFKNY